MSTITIHRGETRARGVADLPRDPLPVGVLGFVGAVTAHSNIVMHAIIIAAAAVVAVPS